MDKLFRCEDCDKNYGSESGLNNHNQNIHTVNETKDEGETKKSKTTDCECKRDIKELKEVVKVLQKLVMDVLKVKYSQTKLKKNESNNNQMLDLESNYMEDKIELDS